MQQKPSDFLLENHNQRNNANAKHLPQNCGKQIHVECFHNHPDKINDNNSDKNIHCGSPAYQLVNLIYKESDKDDVNNIYRLYVYEIKHVIIFFPMVLLLLTASKLMKKFYNRHLLN